MVKKKHHNELKLTDERAYYKPWNYPWAYEAWLKHEQSHWLAKEIPMHEDVKDWKRKLSIHEKNFLTNIFRFFTQGDIDVAGGYVRNYLPVFPQPEVRMMLLGFAARECFDKETEVLTEYGWKYFKDLGEEKVAQMDSLTSEISFVKPLDYISKHYKGELHHYKGERTDICVTPNHRLFLINPHNRKVSFKESCVGIWGRNFKYPVNGIVKNNDELTALERLLIAIQADGTIRSRCESYKNDKSRINDYAVDIGVKKQRKVDRVISLLQEVGINCHPRKQENGLVKFTFSLSGLISREKFLTIKDFSFIDISTLSSKKASDIIDEVCFWDGNIGKQMSYWNVNEKSIDTIQAITTLSKYSCTKGINRDESVLQILNNKHVTHSKRCFVLTFTEEKTRVYPHRQNISYDDMVYCVTMPKGTVVTRRKGRVSIQGNCVHIDAYSHLIETLGMPESTYNEFLEYAAMREKHDYVTELSKGDFSQISQQIAVFSAFTEGLQLFSSFIMLMNFPRHGKMKGMGQVISYSLIDETMHCEGMIKLFRTYIEENPELWTDELKSDIYKIADKMVELEDKFIDLAFEQGPMEDLTIDDMKKYIRYIADRRLISLGLKGIFKIKKNPLIWVEEMINATQHSSFFETKSVAYAKGALSGSWDDVWECSI